MKGVLEFSLPEEIHEFEMAQSAGTYRAAAYDFNEWLRGQIKYGPLSPEEEKVFQSVRDRFNEEFEGLDL